MTCSVFQDKNNYGKFKLLAKALMINMSKFMNLYAILECTEMNRFRVG